MSSRNPSSKSPRSLTLGALVIAFALAITLPMGHPKATYASLATPAPSELLVLALLAVLVASLTVLVLRFLILPYLRRNGIMGLVPLIAIGSLAWLLLRY